MTQPAILSFRVHFLSPFSYQTIKSHLDLYFFSQFLQYSVDYGNFIAISGIAVSVIEMLWGEAIASISSEAITSITSEAIASISNEAIVSVTDTAIPEIAMKLPSSTEYWRNWKKEYRSKWDFIVWYENGLKKWTRKERIADCVNVNLHSNLKCIHEKLRDTLEDEGGKEKYINCKFEEIKMKSVKRSKSCHYVDDLSAVL